MSIIGVGGLTINTGKKWRWRVLRDGTGFHNMEKVSKCINGLAALHNFIIKNEKEEMTAEEIKNYRDAV